MMKRRPRKLEGRVFGFVTVGEEVAERAYGHRLRRCTCVCGTEWLVRTNDLLRGQVKSCGCNGVSDEDRAINISFDRYRQDAKKRGIAFRLSKQEFRTLVFQPCHYCGAAPRLMWRSFRKAKPSRRQPIPVPMNGVDRLNNEPFYRLSNSVPCCQDCNTTKLDRSVEEFRRWTLRAGTHRLMRYPNLTELTQYTIRRTA
jgi:hypothetical protein